MSIINDIMNPSNLLEVDDDQFRVQPFTPKQVVIDCDATTCEDCNAKDCPLYSLKGN